MKIRQSLIILAAVGLALAGLATFGASAATTHTVCDAGCDFTTVEAAVGTAAAGDTINVAPGLYNVASPLTFNVPLTLNGPFAGTVGHDGVRDRTNPATEAILDASGIAPLTGLGPGDDQYHLFDIQSDGVTIAGFTIANMGANSVSGDEVDVLRAAVFDDLTFENNIVHELTNNDEVLDLINTYNVGIRGNLFHQADDTTRHASTNIRMWLVTGSDITNNHFDMGYWSNAGDLIRVQDSSGLDVEGNAFYGAAIDAPHGDIVDVAGTSDRITFTDNTFTSANAPGTAVIRISADSSQVTGDGNQFFDNANVQAVSTNPSDPLGIVSAIAVDASANLASHSFQYNEIYGNDQGVLVTGTPPGGETFDALNNWWGDAEGPNTGSTSTATGDRISDHVAFDPWLPQSLATAIRVEPLTLIDVLGNPADCAVSPAGQFASLQTAVDCALDGARVLVPSGLFTEAVTINTGITVCQAGSGDQCNAAGQPELVILDAPAGSPATLTIASDDVTVTGMTLRNGGGTGDQVAVDLLADGATLNGNIVRVSGGGCSSDDIITAACTPATINGLGTSFAKRHDTTITDNTFAADLPADDGTIGGNYGLFGQFPNGVVADNIFTGWANTAAFIGGSNLHADNNAFDANGVALKFCDHSNQLATDNVFGSGFNAFQLSLACGGASDRGLVLRGNDFGLLAGQAVTVLNQDIHGADYTIDARLNHWAVDTAEAIDLAIGDTGDTTVLATPFLLDDGSAEPGLPVVSSHSGDAATCGSHFDADDDCTFLTVQAALDFADAGATVALPGSSAAIPTPYTGSIVMPAGVTLTGAGSDTTIIAADSATGVLVPVGSDGSGINNVTIRNSAADHFQGILLDGDQFTLADSLIDIQATGCSGGCYSSAAVYGIYADGAGATIARNTFRSLPGINDDGSDGGLGGEGFVSSYHIDGTPGLDLSDNTFTGWIAGAKVVGGHIEIAGNDFTANENHLMACTTGGGINVTDNQFGANTGFAPAAIRVGGGCGFEDLRLTGNNLATSTGTALSIPATAHGDFIDASRNDWGVYDCLAIRNKVSDATPAYVKINPFLLPDGTEADCATLSEPGDVILNGDLFSTIQSALDAAVAGDIVTVSRGLYQESLDFLTDGVTLQGAGAPDVRIEATGADTATVAANDVTITGVTLANSGPNNIAAARVTGDRFTFTNGATEIQPTMCDGGCYSSESVHAFHIGGTDATIGSSQLTALPGINADGSNGGFGGEAVVADLGTGMDGLTFIGNDVTGWILGIKAQGSAITLADNGFTGNEGHIALCPGSGGIDVTGNTLSESLTAIRIAGGCDADDASIHGNTIALSNSVAITDPTGAPVDARLNNWGLADWRLVQQRAGANVQAVPFLLDNGNAEPGLPTASPASHSTTPATCDAHPDALYAGGECNFLTLQAAADFAHAGSTIGVGPSINAAAPAAHSGGVVLHVNNEAVPEALDGVTLCSSLGGALCATDVTMGPDAAPGVYFETRNGAWEDAPGYSHGAAFHTAANQGTNSLYLSSAGLQLDEIDALRVDLYLENGVCGAGSPRFSTKLLDDTGAVFTSIQIATDHTAACPVGTWITADAVAGDAIEANAVLGTGNNADWATVHAAAVSLHPDYTIGTMNMNIDGAPADLFWDNLRINGYLIAEAADTTCSTNVDACRFAAVAEATLVDGAPNAWGVDVAAANVAVKGLTVRNSDVTGAGGIRVAASGADIGDNLVIGNLDQSASTFDVWGSQFGIAVWSGSNDYHIHDNTVSGWDNMGINIAGSGSGAVDANTIAFNTNHGLYIGGGSGDFTASGNTFGAHDNTAVRLATTRATTFRDNVFTPGNNNGAFHVHDGATNGPIDARANYWSVVGRDVIPAVFAFDSNPDNSLIDYMPYQDSADRLHPPAPLLYCLDKYDFDDGLQELDIHPALDLDEVALLDPVADLGCAPGEIIQVFLYIDVEAYDGATFDQEIRIVSESDGFRNPGRIYAGADDTALTFHEGAGHSVVRDVAFELQSNSTGVHVDGLTDGPVNTRDAQMIGTDDSATGVRFTSSLHAGGVYTSTMTGVHTGVTASDSDGVYIRDNHIAARQRGIQLANVDTAYVEDNVLVGGGLVGWALEENNAGRLSIQRNTMTGFGAGMWLTSTNTVSPFPDVIANNTLRGMTRGLVLDSSAGGTITHIKDNTLDELVVGVELQGSGITANNFLFRGNDFGAAIQETFDVRIAGITNNVLDARYNHWYAYDNGSVHDRMDLTPGNVVDASCFLDLDKATPICPPSVDFTTTIAPGAGYPRLVDFAASVTGDQTIESLTWDFGDGVTASDDLNVDHYYQAGSYVTSLAVADSAGYEVTVTKPLLLGTGYAFTLVNDISPYQEVSPGQTLTYTATLTNTGTDLDQYTFALQDEAGWGWSTPGPVTLAGGDSTTISVSATVPAGAAGGKVLLTALSAGNPGVIDNVFWLTSVPVKTTVQFADNGVFYEGDEVRGLIRLTYNDGAPLAGVSIDLTHYHDLLRSLGLGSLTRSDLTVVTDDEGVARFSLDLNNAPWSVLRGSHTLELRYESPVGDQFVAADFVVRPVGLVPNTPVSPA